MSLEIYMDKYKHYDGKEYINALIRDAGNPEGPALHVTNFAKTLHDDFSAGSVNFTPYSVFAPANVSHSKEGEKREKRGYSEVGAPIGWRMLTSRQEDNLNAKGVAFAIFHGTPVPTAPQSHTYGAVQGVEDPATDVVVVPGSSTLGPKRVEWVLEHADHPEAFSQMMHAAGQLQKVADDAQDRAAKANTDLEFAKAWMAARMRQEAG